MDDCRAASGLSWRGVAEGEEGSEGAGGRPPEVLMVCTGAQTRRSRNGPGLRELVRSQTNCGMMGTSLQAFGLNVRTMPVLAGETLVWDLEVLPW